MAAHRTSSPLSTAIPLFGSAATSSDLPRATSSIVPNTSVCTAATAVTTPIVGRPISHSMAMWPMPRAPISNTPASAPSGAFSNVSGSPSSLLKLPGLAAITKR